MKKEGTVFPFPLFVFFRERHDVFPFAENKKNLTSEEVRGDNDMEDEPLFIASLRGEGRSQI